MSETRVRASKPGRASAKLRLTIELVNMNIAIYKGTDSTGISRSRFVVDKDGKYHPVGNQNYNKDTGEVVQYGDIVKLFDTDKGPVELSDDEIKNVVKAIPSTAEIVGFFPLRHMFVGTYVPDSYYQVRPAKMEAGKKKVDDPVATTLLDAMLRAMRKLQVFALARVTMREGSLPQYAAILPNARLFTLFYDNDVREQLPLPENVAPDAMVEKFVELVQSHYDDDAPELFDDATAAVVDYASKKATGDTPDIAEVEDNVTTAEDLMAVLEASIGG